MPAGGNGEIGTWSISRIGLRSILHRQGMQRRRAVRNSAPLIPLASVDLNEWQDLAARAIEPNGCYLPGWELAVSATARGRTGASALRAIDASSRLIGLMPVVSLLASLQNSPARPGQRTSLRHTVQPAARSRCGARCRNPTARAGPRGRRPRADPARHRARRRGDAGAHGCISPRWRNAARAEFL